MISIAVSQALFTVLLISGLPLIFSSVSSLIVSVFQAATSIQEQCISYLVKLTTLILIMYFCGDFFLSKIIDLIRQTLRVIVYLNH